MRLELSKRTDMALKALARLDPDDDLSGADLASAIGTTVNYLPQVLRPLVVSELVCSTPGPGGGYRLSVDLEGLSVLEVIEAVEGGLDQTTCVLRGAPCPATDHCALHDSWQRARGALLTELGATSVASTLVPAPKKGE